MEQRNSKSPKSNSGNATRPIRVPPPASNAADRRTDNLDIGNRELRRNDPTSLDSGKLDTNPTNREKVELSASDLGSLDLTGLDVGAIEIEDELRLAPLEEPLSLVEVQRVSTAGKPATASLAKVVTSQAVAMSSPADARARAKPAILLSETPPVEAIVEIVAEPDVPSRRRWFGAAAPSWAVSLVVHVAILFTLAAITLDPIDKVLSILNAATAETQDSIEEFDMPGPQLDTPETQEALSSPTTEVSQVVEMPELSSLVLPTSAPSVDVLDTNRLTESIMPSAMLSGGALSQLTVSLNSRSSASKSEMLERFGGTSESEKAVALALKWIAEHQALNGGWTFAHSEICHGQCDGSGELALATNGATAMAILPFLGAGQTHLEGQYKQTIHNGLSFLINRMKVTSGQLPEGSWHEPGGTMYSHGLAAIAICEAYAMTRDPDLLQPAQLSLNYLIASQDPHGGGWRYEPRQPGDTSVVGWCVMALKSGRMGNLIVPEETFMGAKSFLDSVSTNHGAYYGYDHPEAKVDGRHAVTAVGLLCRMYMGWPKEHPGIKEGVEYLSQTGPNKDDLYYSYYATQVMRHNGGPAWERWNARLRDELIASQVAQGHAAGSWVANGAHSSSGGRLYATSLATMILEVYYRHMPLYSEKSAEDDFKL